MEGNDVIVCLHRSDRKQSQTPEFHDLPCHHLVDLGMKQVGLSRNSSKKLRQRRIWNVVWWQIMCGLNFLLNLSGPKWRVFVVPDRQLRKMNNDSGEMELVSNNAVITERS